jgi:ABC-type oligopeptide transport system substrate-binding subunit
MQQDFTQLWHTGSRNGQSGNNYSGFGSVESDALIDSIKFATVDTLRYALSKRLQKLIYDEQPCVFMYSTQRKVILHRRWGNQSIYAEFPCFILNNLKLLVRTQTVASFLTHY